MSGPELIDAICAGCGGAVWWDKSDIPPICEECWPDEYEKVYTTLREAVSVLEWYAYANTREITNDSYLYKHQPGQKKARDFLAAHPELRQREDGS